MTRALIIDPQIRLRIAKLILLATATPFDPARAKDAYERDPVAYRDMMEAYSLDMPIGYHVTYSHEIQPPGVCHHISITVEADEKLPGFQAVEMILEEFGMQPLARSLNVWIEHVSPTIGAVNILQLVKP